MTDVEIVTTSACALAPVVRNACLEAYDEDVAVFTIAETHSPVAVGASSGEERN